MATIPLIGRAPRACGTAPNRSTAAAARAVTPVPGRYEYYSRVFVVTLTFALAISIPKLNLLMDLIGSLSGVLICLTIPALVHLASYWDVIDST